MNLSAEILNTFPAVDEKELDALLAEEIRQNDQKIVVLDDDPTGVQTVHDISVYTDWSLDSIRQGFKEENKVFYILTNSRGMTVAETTKAHTDIAKRIAAVSKETGIDYMIMSRSDSTLRGHYPLEPQLLRDGMEADGHKIDGEVMCPFFKEGGRFTIGNVHYVKQGDELVRRRKQNSPKTAPSATAIPHCLNISKKKQKAPTKLRVSHVSVLKT